MAPALKCGRMAVTVAIDALFEGQSSPVPQMPGIVHSERKTA